MLQPAINMGLSEFDFWDMTLAEVLRYIKGAEWRFKAKAQYDYTLADLIGISVGRILSKEAEYPPIKSVYPNLFEEDAEDIIEKQEEEQDVKSVNNFLAFAQKHNTQVKRGEI